MKLSKAEAEGVRVLEELFGESPELPLDPNRRLVIMSDLHLGNGNASDDFLPNAALTLDVLSHYARGSYGLILNGDVEELLRFELKDIKARWGKFYELLADFQTGGGLVKVVGNHDIDLLAQPDPDFPVVESLRLTSGGDTMFVFHGHQLSRRLRRPNPFITFILRYVATPLRIRNYSVSADSARKFKVERLIFSFSARRRIVSVIGHTHRPLFESMSKIDSLRFEIEQMCLAYDAAPSEVRVTIAARVDELKAELSRVLEKDDRLDSRSSLYTEALVVPCLFNSGTAIGKRGITCLELEGGMIRLVHWFDARKNVGVLQRPIKEIQQIGADRYRVVIKEDRLEHVFNRIRLIGG